MLGAARVSVMGKVGTVGENRPANRTPDARSQPRTLQAELARNVQTHSMDRSRLTAGASSTGKGRTAARIAEIQRLQSTSGNRAVLRLLYNSEEAEPAARNADGTSETAPPASRPAVAHATPALPSDQPRASDEAQPHTRERHQEEEATALATVERHPVPSFTPSGFPDSSENNGSDGGGRAPADAVVGPAAAKAAASAPAANALINGNAVDQANLIKADSARSEAQILKIADTNRKNVSVVLGGLRGRFASFFGQSSAGVRRLISGTQAEISAAAAGVVQSAQVVVVNAARTARTQADRVRGTIEGAVKTTIGSVQERVRGIADGITGVVNRFPLPDIPGVAQIRSAIGGVLRRGADVVTSGLPRLRSLISSALSLGQQLVTSMIGVFERLADAALAQVGNAIQRVIRVVAQTLQRVATQVISALQKIFNGSVLPMIARLERMTHQAIGQAQQHAISAIHSNRDQHLQSLVPQSQAKGGAAPAPAGAGNPAPGGAADEAVQNNKTIIQIFQERSSAILASVLERISATASQIVDHVSRSVAQVTQLITGKVREVTQALTQAVQVVRSFVQSAVDALTNALDQVITHVHALIDSPVDQLVRFGQGVLDGINSFVSRIVSNIVSFITGGTPAHEAGTFNPTPTLAPSPAYLGPALPALFALLAALVALVGGSVIVVGGTVIIIIGGSVFFVSTTVVIIVAVVVALLLLLLLIYVLYRILKKRPQPSEKIISETVQTSPGARTRTDIGVGEEVDLTYTGGSTTWTTTGGSLSAVTGPSVVLKAPDTAQAVIVTAGTAAITFQIIAPSRVFMARTGAMQHDKGYPNVGIRMRPYLLPDNVNFYNVVYHEMDVNGVPTAGEYSCNPFKTGHCGAGGGGVPCPDLPVTNTVVAGQGTQTLNDDCAYSGYCTTTGPPYAPGSVSLNIPHEYKVGSGGVHPFAPVSQVHTLEADADTLTTVKGEAKGKTSVNATSSSNGC
ncbi:membrane protein implicated in regulation of membrane protease activity [Paraburkholderia sp. GAS42]